MHYFPGEFVRDLYKADDGQPCDGWIPSNLWMSTEEAVDFLKKTSLDELSPDLARVVRLAVNESILDNSPCVVMGSQMAHELVRIAEEFDYPVVSTSSDQSVGSQMDILYNMLDFREEHYN